jgi:hypothetical protein
MSEIFAAGIQLRSDLPGGFQWHIAKVEEL